MLMSVDGAAGGAAASWAVVLAVKIRPMEANRAFCITPSCSRVCPAVKVQKNVSRAWGTADIARKWEGERRVRHPFVTHMDDRQRVAFCLTRLIYNSQKADA